MHVSLLLTHDPHEKRHKQHDIMSQRDTSNMITLHVKTLGDEIMALNTPVTLPGSDEAPTGSR